ncbi:MAG: metallophosphoesterase [Clostridia bacterium]|nr:metallophosphoesterase [Clostridia bacterium]
MLKRIICFALALVSVFMISGNVSMYSNAETVATLTLTHDEGGIIHFGGDTAGTDVSTMTYIVGSTANFQVDAYTGYYIETVTIGGVSQTVNANASAQVFAFVVAGDTAIHVTFIENGQTVATEMTVKCHVELGNGSVTLPDGSTSGVFDVNSSVTVDIAPGAYYAIDAISLDGQHVEVKNNGAAQSITFTAAPMTNTINNTINVIVDFTFTGVREHGNTNYANSAVQSLGAGYYTKADAIMIAPGKTVSAATADICEALCVDSITVLNADGTTASDSTVFSTGMKINADRFTYNVVVGGDVNADGSVDVSDISAAYASIHGTDLAGGVNYDAALLSATRDSVSVLDVMAMLNVTIDGTAYTLGKNYLPNVKYYGENGVDFVVDIEHDNEIKILQLTDTQIMAMNYARTNGRYLELRNAFFTNAEFSAYEKCLKYVKNAIEQTNPDIIVLTGDNVYGETDDKGIALQTLADYIDSFGIPWAAVYGNHDNESGYGVLGQNKIIMNAKYSIFKPGTVTGNSNYNIALRQNGSIKYMLYMGDTNGCAVLREDVGDGILTSNVDFEHVYTDYGMQSDAQALIKDNMDTLAAANSGTYVPSLMFIHIQAESEAASGLSASYMKELDARNVKGLFHGHIHERSYGYTYTDTNIYCAYGVKTGTYDSYLETSLGGRLITIDASGGMATEKVPYNGN